MAFRIETYVHSDNITRNKGAAMVRVEVEDDFATRTDAFLGFARAAAVAAYAHGVAASWEEIVAGNPEVDVLRKQAELDLGVAVDVTGIVLMGESISVAAG